MARRLSCGGVALAWLALAACAGGPPPNPADLPTTPLPTAGLAGSEVAVYPLTMLIAEVELGWDTVLPPRSEALRQADDLIFTALEARSPEVTWVGPEELRRAARGAPGMLSDPDQMGSSMLRSNIAKVPDPLRAQLRMLTGAVADRYALIPASALFFADSTTGARVELTLVLVDVRSGDVGWRTVAQGAGDDPWTALRAAMASLTPGLP